MRKVIAVLGESQVGKSSLINSILGRYLLPTSGAGSSCTKVVIEIDAPASQERAEDWRMSLIWVDDATLVRTLADPQTHSARFRVLSENEQVFGSLRTRGRQEAMARLQELSGWGEPIHAIAAGRELPRIPTGPVSARELSEVMDALATTWVASCVERIHLSPLSAVATTLVDLPGVGGYDDLGSQNCAAWLEAHAGSVRTVVCVVGQSGLGQATARALQQYFLKHADCSLHVVATYADHHVDHPATWDHLRRAAEARRRKAAEQVAELTGESVVTLSPRTYCLDPRYPRIRGSVEFPGELKRLRSVLLDRNSES